VLDGGVSEKRVQLRVVVADSEDGLDRFAGFEHPLELHSVVLVGGPVFALELRVKPDAVHRKRVRYLVDETRSDRLLTARRELEHHRGHRERVVGKRLLDAESVLFDGRRRFRRLVVHTPLSASGGLNSTGDVSGVILPRPPPLLTPAHRSIRSPISTIVSRSGWSKLRACS
jgi:hypothetical protein